MKCSVLGCQRLCHAHGFCELHYRRWRRRGNTEAPSIIQRFWGYIDCTGGFYACWPWLRCLDEGGYGLFGIVQLHRSQRIVRAHRFSYELTYGTIPEEAQVLHQCDFRACCNPFHLFLGDNAQNVADKMAKGRHRAQQCGAGNTQARLTNEDIDQIRRCYAAGGISQDHLAREFGVHQTQISRIVRRKQWSNLVSKEA